MAEPIISVSGLRGVVDLTFTREVASRYASAFALTAPSGGIVVTRDGRESGIRFADAICRALNSMGRDVLNAEIAATPTTGVLVRDSKLAGGIQISASHNPAEYNGMKLFSADGRVLSAKLGQMVLDTYQSSVDPADEEVTFGNLTSIRDTTSVHESLVLATVDRSRIAAKQFRVALDSSHGAGSLLAKPLLEQLGCATHLHGTPPDGQFEHPPEPTAENLASLSHTVREMRADVGFAQDPDADRLALVDETGRYIGEEYTVAICLDHVLKHNPGPVVTNCSTSRMSEDLAAKHNVPFYRSRVGEANVCDMMLSQGAVFGGEGNGGPIDPRVGYVRDSFVGMALVLDCMAEQELPLSEIVDALPRYAIHKAKVEMPSDQVLDAMGRLQRHFADAQADDMDGLRLDWPGRWLLVRPSNTEPIVRIIAESETVNLSQSMCTEARQVLEA